MTASTPSNPLQWSIGILEMQPPTSSSDSLPAPADRLLSLDMHVARWWNLAASQNHVPIIRQLTVELKGGVGGRTVELRVHSSPGFTQPFSLRIDGLQPGGRRVLRDLEIRPDHRYLAGLTSALEGTLRVETLIDDVVVGAESCAVRLLAPDQWGGLSDLPEMLAALIQPDHPFVDVILTRAGELLKLSGISGLNGYQQQSREIVGRQIAAIYAALREREFVLVERPTDFLKPRHGIRLPDQIETERLATRLDLAVLFAACLERAGLHPLILIKEGHAWLGCWLDEGSSCAGPVDEDGHSLRRRRAAGELSSLELERLTNKSVLFADAERAGRDNLEDETHFQVAFDVRLARQSGIRPLPVRVEGAFKVLDEPAPGERAPEERTPEEGGSAGPNRRLERWKRKLLDLSLRNRLINFKPTARMLGILGTDLANLEDALAAHRSFGFEAYAGQEPNSPHADACARGQLTALEKDEEKLDARLTALYRTARTAEEESGASPLYLSLGILEWKETARSTTVVRAPILLMPVLLTRSSVSAGVSGFKLTSRDEDTRINPTLLEKLRRDLGIALDIPDTRPADEGGVNVERVLGLFREVAAKQKGWDVKEELWLGEFSFKKFLMWRDLQEQEAALRAHPLVNQMLERPHMPLPSQGEFPDPRKLDASFAAEEVFTPLMADSSQLAAIQAASEGRSFVLEGPPGTGKSQTITNLIAHCIAHGKTVLFISEKKAALEVVRKRLAEINLGAFCLEVHSDKARRTEIIEQLKAPLRFSTAGVRRQWQETSGSLGTLRATLNHYVEALHHRFPCGLSIYDSIGRLCGRPAAHVVPLGWGDPHAWNGASLIDMRSLVTGIAPLLVKLGPLKSHALCESALKDSSPLIERSARERVRATRIAFLTLWRSVKRVAQRLQIAATDLNAGEIDLIADLSGKLFLLGGLPKPIAGVIGDPATIERLQTAIRVIQQRQAISRELRSQFDQAFLSADMDELTTLHRDSLHSWWPRSLLRGRRLRGILRGYTQDAAALERGYAHLPEAAAKVRTLRELDGHIKSLEALTSCLGEAWEGPRSEVKHLLECAHWLESVFGIVSTLSRGDALRMQHLIDGARELGEMDTLDPALRSIAPARDALRHAVADLAATLQMERVSIDPSAPDYLQRTRKWVVEIQKALVGDQLRYWAAWQRVRERASAMGLDAILEYCIEREGGAGGAAGVDLAEVFEASILHWVLEEGLARSAPLKDFIGRSQDQLIVEFRKLDAEYLSLASSAVAARVEARIPRDGQDAVAAQELALLRKEFSKKTRHRPLRQLFSGMPGMMSRLKPCLLMSPLSVAQHLATDFPPFDLVIFDEASQIPVWDAIGAIARARQAVVVGDPKQMPPTSFFSREDDEDSVDAAEDLESILDETMTTLPIQRLEWHYRSRFESLITFSNRRYYDGRLVTFPSPVAEDRAVQLHRVNGIYDRGVSRTNRLEAEAVVGFVLEHLRAPGAAGSSIGVVTFNAQQQQLIDDLFDDARREDPALEKYFAQQDGTEEVFVKNLENVQGDERDVIVFSTTFGLDASGKMSLNFGPINSANGPRRLNVAITRSRLAMHVFTSIPHDRLDTTRTTSIGVRHLKEFIDYAERGVDALHEATSAASEGPGAPFEDAVAAALRDKGWEVHQQIGCGGYRIDLGVVNPDAPGTYLAGVECDGAGYHRSATARDRDRLRPHKLAELGWTLYRVWSTEYWREPRAEIEKLHRFLGAQSTGSRG